MVEARVPEMQRLPLGQTVLPWRADPDGMSYYVYDVVTQRLSGQHYHLVDGRVQASPIEMRYAWPAELDLMARLAGMRLQDRWAGWRREPFTRSAPHTSRSTRSAERPTVLHLHVHVQDRGRLPAAVADDARRLPQFASRGETTTRARPERHHDSDASVGGSGGGKQRRSRGQRSGLSACGSCSACRFLPETGCVSGERTRGAPAGVAACTAAVTVTSVAPSAAAARTGARAEPHAAEDERSRRR